MLVYAISEQNTATSRQEKGSRTMKELNQSKANEYDTTNILGYIDYLMDIEGRTEEDAEIIASCAFETYED
jgi:hypothetical protein